MVGMKLDVSLESQVAAKPLADLARLIGPPPGLGDMWKDGQRGLRGSTCAAALAASNVSLVEENRRLAEERAYLAQLYLHQEQAMLAQKRLMLQQAYANIAVTGLTDAAVRAGAFLSAHGGL